MASCHSAAGPAPATRVGAPALPRLPAPLPLDPAARGAAYLNAVALQLQPGWGQFLDDCRLRLPAMHPLNAMSRSAAIELAIDGAGRVEVLRADPSGDDDFDRAARGVLADAAPLPVPPIELRSDDDRVHLRWRFARDRRQAGPATASIVEVDLPLAGVVDGLVASGDLARAARRIRRAPAADPARRDAATALMSAVLREATASSDGAAQRAALVAIGRAHRGELAGELRAHLAPTQDVEVRRLATEAVIALRDGAAVAQIANALSGDLRDEPALVPVDVRALVALGHAREATAALAAALDPAPADAPTLDRGRSLPAAIAALALVPDPARAAQLDRWLAHGDPRTRAAACAALAYPGASWTTLARGLHDPDAGVRAACATAATAPLAPRGTPLAPATVMAALRGLLRDRDDAVRAAAVGAIGRLDGDHPAILTGDASPAVRAAVAVSLAASAAPAADAALGTLAADRDGEVRATAVAALAFRGAPSAALATSAASDPAPRVRLVAAATATDAALLARLVDDADPLVASEALIRRTAVLGAAAGLDPTLDRVASAPPGSSERVRAALAWLLAP